MPSGKYGSPSLSRNPSWSAMIWPLAGATIRNVPDAACLEPSVSVASASIRYSPAGASAGTESHASAAAAPGTKAPSASATTALPFASFATIRHEPPPASNPRRAKRTPAATSARRRFVETCPR